MPDMSDRMGGPKRQDPEAEVALDAKGLRALAHPVRVQLVELLRTYGPSTATRLAARLGITSGNASYRLKLSLATAASIGRISGARTSHFRPAVK